MYPYSLEEEGEMLSFLSLHIVQIQSSGKEKSRGEERQGEKEKGYKEEG